MGEDRVPEAGPQFLHAWSITDKAVSDKEEGAPHLKEEAYITAPFLSGETMAGKAGIQGRSTGQFKGFAGSGLFRNVAVQPGQIVMEEVKEHDIDHVLPLFMVSGGQGCSALSFQVPHHGLDLFNGPVESRIRISCGRKAGQGAVGKMALAGKGIGIDGLSDQTGKIALLAG
jgi:hypothetical protein